jgi:hypothetical protein
MHGQEPFRGTTEYFARLHFAPSVGKLLQHLPYLAFVFDTQASIAYLPVES